MPSSRPWWSAALLLAAPVLMLTVACGEGAGPAADAPSAPLNVVVITLDTTRADALGVYGQELPVSPRIDSMAAEGVLFEQAMSSAPSTLPSHATILTGRQPYSHGARSNIGYRLSEENLTLAEILAEQGYATAAEVAAPVLASHRQLSQGFDVYREPEVAIMDALEVLQDRVAMRFTRPAEEITESGLAFLRGHAAEPFFLWLHYFDPHEPRDPPAPFAGRLENPYLEEVSRVDHAVGQLLDEIERLGLRKRTLVVLTADHGEGLGDHGEQTHSFFLYETTLHVPLIFWGAGVPAGVRVGSLVRLADIAPSVIDWLGLSPLAQIDGVSLVPFFEDPARDPRLAGYGETIEWRLSLGGDVLRTLREGRWKYLHKLEPALYDVEADPAELHNLAPEEEERVGEMRRRLAAMLGAAPRAPEDAESPVGPEQLEQLRALGYAAEVTAPQTAPALDALELEGPDPDHSQRDIRLYVQAVGNLAEGEFRRAEILYGELHRLHPHSTSVLAGLIHANQSLGKQDEAALLMRKFIELDPAAIGQRLELAKLLSRRGETDDAERLLKEVLSLDRCSDAARLQLSQIERRRGRQSRRIAVLAEGVAGCPEPVVARNALAYALATVPDASLRDADKALRLAQASVDDTQAQHPDYLDTLAAAYAENGDFERAIETQRQALALVQGRELSPKLVEHLERHLALYEAGKPLRLP